MVEQTIAILRQEEKAVKPGAQIKLTRRELLKGSGILMGSIALTSSLALIAPSLAWALQLQRLNTHQAEVLLTLGKRMFPHKNLDDAIYALLVKALDDKAAQDQKLHKQLVVGIRGLDQPAPHNDWNKQSVVMQLTDIGRIANTPFFETVRSTAIVALYSNTLAYQHFGYLANAGDVGYLHSGFNNLAWLPNPADADSGPLPVQQ